MQKPADFDSVNAYGDFTPLPAGGYVCRIMGVEETQAKSSGAPMIKISVDIADGEFRDYFKNMYLSDTRQDKKWSYSAVVNQLVYDTNGSNSTNRGFKTFITAAEESNPGFRTVWGNGFAQCFKDRLIGVIFGREEYFGTDGKCHWSTKAQSFRSVETIRKGDFKIPEDKHAQNAQGGTQNAYSAAQGNYTTYGNNAAQAQSVPPTRANLADFEEIPISASDLPF